MYEWQHCAHVLWCVYSKLTFQNNMNCFDEKLTYNGHIQARYWNHTAFPWEPAAQMNLLSGLSPETSIDEGLNTGSLVLCSLSWCVPGEGEFSQSW